MHNQGYQDFGATIIKKVNGHDIRNLRELIATVENSDEPFISFEADMGFKIVLDRERVRAEQSDILKTYQVGRDRSVDLIFAGQTVVSKGR